jgi:hypothetical protein
LPSSTRHHESEGTPENLLARTGAAYVLTVDDLVGGIFGHGAVVGADRSPIVYIIGIVVGGVDSVVAATAMQLVERRESTPELLAVRVYGIVSVTALDLIRTAEAVQVVLVPNPYNVSW